MIGKQSDRHSASDLADRVRKYERALEEQREGTCLHLWLLLLLLGGGGGETAFFLIKFAGAPLLWWWWWWWWLLCIYPRLVRPYNFLLFSNLYYSYQHTCPLENNKRVSETKQFQEMRKLMQSQSKKITGKTVLSLAPYIHPLTIFATTGITFAFPLS